MATKQRLIDANVLMEHRCAGRYAFQHSDEMQLLQGCGGCIKKCE